MTRLSIFIGVIILTFKILCSNVFAGPTFVDEYDVSTDETTPTGVIFNPDGTRMYIVGIDNDRIRQYTLSVAFDVTSTITLQRSRLIDSVENRPQDIKFNSDGTVIFVLGTENDGVARWSLSTPYDINTLTVADSTYTSVGGDPRGFDFNNDGTKMFILDGSQEQVEEYKLTTPYNPDTKILSKTLSTAKGSSYHQGLGFSPDGLKMYVVKGAKAGSVGNSFNNILEYNLTTSFDIATATLNGTYTTSHSSNEYIAGITFNNDGSKMYHINFNADEIREYTLTCAYGIISCIDQTKDKDTVGNAEAQAELSKKFMQSTSIPVLNRMEWLRRNKNNINLTNQNIKFQFSNTMLNSIKNSFVTPAALNKNNLNDFMPEGWSSWSEGNISFGRTGDTNKSSRKKNNTTGITIGADKKVSKNKLYGIALRFGNDDVDVGNLGNILDMNAYSLTLYGTLPQGESNFIDSLIGISTFQTDIVSANGDNKLNGNRDGDQIFGSLKIRKTIKKNQFNFTPTAKIDLGYTLLSEYTEKGSDALKLKFDEQEIKTVITSVGMIFDNSIDIESGVLKPNAHLEYNADISSSSESKFYYVADTSKSYVISNVNDSNHNIRMNLGIDLIKDDGWSFKSNYERNQNETGYSDTLYIGATYISANDSEYALALDGEKTFVNYTKNINGFDIEFNSNYSLFTEVPDYGANIKVSTIF